MAEFTIGAHTYRSAKMNARTQFNVARKLLPVLSSASGLKDFASPPPAPGADGEPSPPAPTVDIGVVLGTLTTAIASVSDADCDYVLDACLAVTSRQIGTSWAPLWNAQARRAMYDDMELADLLGIAAHVIQENAGSFLAAAPSGLGAMFQTTSTLSP